VNNRGFLDAQEVGNSFSGGPLPPCAAGEPDWKL